MHVRTAAPGSPRTAPGQLAPGADGAGPRPTNRQAAALVGVAATLSLGWHLLPGALGVQLDPWVRELVHGLANAALQTTGSVLLWRGARRCRGRRRVAWSTIAAGATVGAIATSVWAAGLARTGHHPDAGFTQAFFATALALTTAGVAALPPTTERSLRLRAVDAAILMVAALTLVWVAPVHQQSDGRVVTGFDGVNVNQIITVVTILVAVGAIARCRPDRQGEITPMSAALTLSGFGMLMYAGAPADYPTSSQLADTLFMVGFVLAAVTGARLGGPPRPPRRRGADLNGHWLALPEAATITTLVALTMHERWHDSPSVSLTLGGAAVLLAVLRLLQLGLEQRRLSATLQDSAERLHREARTDALTGLGNRLAFDERVRTTMDRLTRTPAEQRTAVAIVFVDVDHFKRFNDALGHAVGDGLLIEAARRLVERCGEHVYRIGGDEFVAVLIGQSDAAARRTSAAVVDAFVPAVVVGDHEMAVSVSAGLATWDDPAAAPPGAPELIRRADLALYRSKELGRGTWTAFDPVLAERARHQHERRAALQHAVESGGLDLGLEPVVRLRGHRLVGATARLCWRWNGSGLDAATISAVAVDGGLVTPTLATLFDQVQRMLLQTAGVSTDVTGSPLWIEVPLTRDELLHPAVCDMVARTVEDPGITASRLRIAVTEATVVDALAVRSLSGIRSLGVHVTVERFGTGPSSLLTMDDYPADEIRLDESFVAGLGRRRDDTVVVTTVTSLAAALGLEVSADGIAEEFAATYLEGLGVATGRGRAFGGRMSARELADRAGRVCWVDPEIDAQVEPAC